MTIDVDKFKEYHEKTQQSGIIMPDLDTFNTKTSMAIALWPQKDSKGKITYLFGKGVGVELALRGTIEGREKNNIEFSYRSHSDFEIYDCANDYPDTVGSKRFREVFGSQEIYPKSETKGLKDIHPRLMDETYEKVKYNGRTFLIPELELLFLDKYLKKESTPREEGDDAFLLLQEYQLDLVKILNYFQEFYLKPSLEHIRKESSGLYQTYWSTLTEKIPESIKSLLEEDNREITFENITELAKTKIQKFREKGISSFQGIPISCIPEDLEFIKLENGKIGLSDKSSEDLKVKIEEKTINSQVALYQERVELINLYNSVYSKEDNNKKGTK